MQTILFRADGNTSIGLGHIMRCMSIADAAKESGYNSIFVTADDKLKDLIVSRGFEHIILHSSFDKMEDELDDIKNVIMCVRPVAVFVDSYFVTNFYMRGIHHKVHDLKIDCRLIYIDDIAAFPYDCDVLVNYNAYGENIDYQKLYRRSDVPAPHFILGPVYAPLRSMFRDVPKHDQPKKIKNILISTGGSDELHLALALISHLTEIHEISATYHFLLGAMNKDKKKIQTLAAKNDRIVLHENVTDMKSLICSCDLAVSAAGSTLYEICACGVPLITYACADNQIPGAKAFAKLGLANNIGDIRNLTSSDPNTIISGDLRYDSVELIMKAIESLSDLKKRKKVSKNMQSLIDGYGADRLFKEIEKSFIKRKSQQ